MALTRPWLTDYPLTGAKGSKGVKPTTAGEHHPELARAMAKRKKAVDKKRAEREKKIIDGKTKVG